MVGEFLEFNILQDLFYKHFFWKHRTLERKNCPAEVEQNAYCFACHTC